MDALKNDPRFPQVEWVYELVRRPHWSIDDAISEMLNLFEERREHIVAFAQQHGLSLHLRLGLHGDETVIIYGIEGLTIERLSAFRCSLSFWVDDDPTEMVGVSLSGDDLVFLCNTIAETWGAVGLSETAFLARTGETFEQSGEIDARLRRRLTASERHYCRSEEARTPLPIPMRLDELRLLAGSIRETLGAVAERDLETRTGETPEHAKEILRRLETTVDGQMPRQDNGTMAESLTVLLSPADLAFLFHARENALRADGHTPATFQSGIEKTAIHADAILVRLGDLLRPRGWRAPFPFSLPLAELRFFVRTISETLAIVEERQFRARVGVTPERAEEILSRFKRILRESERD